MNKQMKLFAIIILLFITTALISCRNESDEDLLIDDESIMETSGSTENTTNIVETDETANTADNEESEHDSVDIDPGITSPVREQYPVLAQDSQAVYYLSDPNAIYGQSWGISEGELTVMQKSPAYIWRGDKGTGYAAPICTKENCTHQDKDCDAAFNASGILGFSLYDGYFYWASMETGMDHEDGIGVYRMRKDGSERSYLGAVPMYSFGYNAEERFTAEWAMYHSLDFPEVYFHRGYCYIVSKTETYGEDHYSGGLNDTTLELSVYAVSLDDFHESHELFTETFENHSWDCTTELRFDENDLVLSVWEGYVNEETGQSDFRNFPPRLSVFRMGLLYPKAKLLFQDSQPYAYPSLYAKDGRVLLLMDDRNEGTENGSVLFEVDEEFGKLRELLTVGKKGNSISFANGYLIEIENPYSVSASGSLEYSGKAVVLHIYDLYGQGINSFEFDPDKTTMAEGAEESFVPFPNILITDQDAFYGYNSQVNSVSEKGFFYMIPLTGSDPILFEPVPQE